MAGDQRMGAHLMRHLPKPAWAGRRIWDDWILLGVYALVVVALVLKGC